MKKTKIKQEIVIPVDIRKLGGYICTFMFPKFGGLYL